MLLDFSRAPRIPIKQQLLSIQCVAAGTRGIGTNEMTMLPRHKFRNGGSSGQSEAFPQETAETPESRGIPRDPEDRSWHNKRELREKMLDKTLADSFPSSDPPSTLPDPEADDSLAA